MNVNSPGLAPLPPNFSLNMHLDPMFIFHRFQKLSFISWGSRFIRHRKSKVSLCSIGCSLGPYRESSSLRAAPSNARKSTHIWCSEGNKQFFKSQGITHSLRTFLTSVCNHILFLSIPSLFVYGPAGKKVGGQARALYIHMHTKGQPWPSMYQLPENFHIANK